MRTKGVRPRISSDYRTYSSADSSLHWLQDPGYRGCQRGPWLHWFSVIHGRLHTGENILTNTRRAGTTSMEHPEFFGYFVRHIYVKVFGYQSFSDLLPRLHAPHLTGRYGEFSTKEEKNIHFCALIFFENSTQQCHNFYGSFGKKKSRLQKKSKLSCT